VIQVAAAYRRRGKLPRLPKIAEIKLFPTQTACTTASQLPILAISAILAIP